MPQAPLLATHKSPFTNTDRNAIHLVKRGTFDLKVPDSPPESPEGKNY